MIYSTNAINKAGKALYSGDQFISDDAEATINQWRLSFQPHMEELGRQLSSVLKAQGISFVRSARVKRLPSIRLKLSAKDDMCLGTMQDIGGVRYIFDTTDTTYKALEAIKGASYDGFSLEKEYDYIARPKEKGYRSIHLVFKTISDDKDKNGYRVEVQLRDKTQHDWAMAVETASVLADTPLKANNVNDTDWNQFFKLVSAIFSKAEGTSVLEKYSGYSHDELCKEYFKYREKVEQLKAIGSAIREINNLKNVSSGWCVLCVNYATKKVFGQCFKESEKESANIRFCTLEAKHPENRAVLLASLDNMSQLPLAYPSFLIDISEFFKELEKFDASCVL